MRNWFKSFPRKWNYFFGLFVLAAALVVANQNCSKVGFQETPWQKEITTLDSELESVQALAYGDSQQDRDFLAAKIAGYKPPQLSEIITKWRRISGATIYNSVNDIVIADQVNSYCASTLDPATGNWSPAKTPAGKNISPATHGDCIDLPWFAAISWTYLPTSRLHHATNSGNFNGFISAVKLERYTHQVTVTSDSPDDDEIALIIAQAVDADGVVHTLSASRTQGGTIAANTNWAVVHRKGTTIVKTFSPQIFDTYNKNPGSMVAGTGWSGRKSLIFVNREGDIVSAKTSKWSMNDADLALDNASEIKIDLSDSTLDLELFRGKKSYGYGLLSQQNTEFYDVKFATPTDATYVYDLALDKVYKALEDGTGAYALLPGASPYVMLKAPIRVDNIETQNTFRLYSNHSFTNIIE